MHNIDSIDFNNKNMISKKDESNFIWAYIAIILVIVFSLFRASIIANLDLTPDEAFYAQWAKKLDLSYYDHPPMVAYIIGIFTSLFGSHEASVRMFPYLSLIAIYVLLYKISYLISTNHAVSFLSVIIISSIPASLALGTIMTPDIPLVVCWTLATYYFCKICKLNSDCIHQQFNYENNKNNTSNTAATNESYKNTLKFSSSFSGIYETKLWCAVGLFLGLGAMSKYTIIFIVPPIAFTMLFFKPLREKIFSYKFILMVLLAALGAFPVIYWNYTNNWISLKFQFQHGFETRKIELWKNLAEFILGQMLTIGPTLFFVFIIYPLLKLYHFYKNNDFGRFFLAFSGIFTLLFFLANSTRSKIEANWPQFAYISLIPIIAESIINSKKITKYFFIIVFPSLILTNLYFVHSITMFLPLPPKVDPTIKLHGWKELGDYFKKIDNETNKKAFFIAQGAPLAGIVAYYGDIPISRVAEANGKGQWGLWWKGKKIELGSTVVYVDENKYSEVDFYASKFKIVRKLAPINITKSNKIIRVINVAIMEDLKEPISFEK